MKDQLIIKLFFERSENAIAELAKQYGGLCRSTALHVLGNEQDAEECVNDAYLALWNAIPPENPESLRAYLCRIVRNQALKRYHRNTAGKRNPGYEVVLDEVAECLRGDGTVEDRILAEELKHHINEFLEQLSEKDRVIFIHRYWFCREISEIAQGCGCSRNYVNVHLHRTRDRLEKYLKKEGLIG